MGAGQAPHKAFQESEHHSRVVWLGANLPIKAEISLIAAISSWSRRETERGQRAEKAQV